MVKEFWNEMLTKESWSKLTELAREFEFIVIGGWAAYLWTKAHKSKDIDIVVDYATLKELQGRFALTKNPRMNKYEIKFDKFDVDIYVPFFSKLAIPPEELGDYTAKVEGIRTVKPEALLVLKQAAEIDRRGSPKGKKDAIDIMTLLAHAKVGLPEYARLLKKYRRESFIDELLYVVRNFSDDDMEYLGMGFAEFRKWKKRIVEEIKALR